LHYTDIAIFTLGYFIFPHPVHAESSPHCLVRKN